MSKQRKGGHFISRERHFARVRIGKTERIAVPLPTCQSDEEAVERAGHVAEVANILLAAGRRHEVERFARGVGAAKTPYEIKVWMTAAKRSAETGPIIHEDSITFEKFATKWTNGELHRAYPDHVRLKSSAGKDAGILAKHVYPVIGDIPLVALRIEHIEAVMRRLPAERSRASRRHVAQAMQKVLRYAVYPARVIASSPLPPGFLPKIGTPKAKSYLYPDEDFRLLGQKKIPVVFRLLYGVMIREGFRYEEIVGSDWSDWDLERGAVLLDENKTSDPRSWALDPYVARAMAAWKKICQDERPFDAARVSHPAATFRGHLEEAGITRPELFERSAARAPLGVHGLRGTFVTLALAAGRTETWVQDRTGHRSTLMVAVYRRVARTVAELGMAALAPISVSIPEIATAIEKLPPRGPGGQQVGSEKLIAGDGGSENAQSNPVVAPPGLEPGRPEGPEILKQRRERSDRAKAGKTAGDSVAPPRPSEGTGHPAAHPAIEAAARGIAGQRLTWAELDVFSILVDDDDGGSQ